MTDAPPEPALPERPTPPRRAGRILDLAAAASLIALAASLAFALPPGSALRALVTLPVVLVVPGYLLVEAAVPSVTPHQRALHALTGLGVSPPLVALLALSTAVLPGGFHAPTIVGLVAAACLGLAAVAMLRRLRAPSSVPIAAAA